MADTWDSNGESGRLDLSLAVTDSRELIHKRELRTDARGDGSDHILSTGQEASTTFIPHQQMTKPEQTEAVEVNRVHSKPGRIADKHAPPSDVHSLSNATVLEEAVVDKPATEDMQNRSSSFYRVSVEKKDTLGYRDYLGVKTHGEGAAFEGGTVASLCLSSRKKGVPTCSKAVLEPWQPLLQHPHDDPSFPPRQAADKQGDVSTSHRNLSVVENQEEETTFRCVLHQTQRQQKRKRRFQRKTLAETAKLFVVAQGRDSEGAEISKMKTAERERSETRKTQDTLKSISSHTSESNTVNVTADSADDQGDDFKYRENAPPTESVETMSASKTTTATTKTCERKKNPTASVKQKSRNSKPSRATKVLDNPVLPQDTQLLSRQVKESKVQKRSKKINLTTLKEESKLGDDGHVHGNNNTAPITNHDASPKPNANETLKDSKDSNSAAIKNNFIKSSSKKSVDCDGMTSVQSITEGPLVLAVTQKDRIKKASRTTITECSTAAVTHSNEPSGVKGTEEVLRLKRKPGRPCRKKTQMKMKMAQLLAIAQEGESNSKVTEGHTLFPQQQYFPHLPQAASTVEKTKKDIKITASTSSASPARRSPRTQSHTPNLKSTVENIDSLVCTSLETALIASGPAEPVVEVETSTGAPLLVPSNDELSIQSETQATAVENIKGRGVHPKVNPERRKSTQSRDSCPPQSVMNESVENGLTKTGRNTVKLHSSRGISKKAQPRTGNDKVYDVPAPREENPITQLQKPMECAGENRTRREEPTDSLLCRQKEPSDSLYESGVTGHSASSLLTTCVKAEPACEQATPPWTKKRTSNTKRARKELLQKRQNEPVLTLNATMGGGSGGPCAQRPGTLDQGKRGTEETRGIEDPQKPRNGTAGRDRSGRGEEGDRRKQTVEPDWGEKCVQPDEIITSQQPDSFPTEIKTEPDEACATPMKVTKKPCRKDGKNSVSLIASNILCTDDDSPKQLGPRNELKLETDDISTAKHAVFVATDDECNQNAKLQGSLATSNITESEGVLVTPKEVKNNVKTIRNKRLVSKQTETNGCTIVSTLITSTSMLQSSSPAPQSVTTVTSLTVQGQVIESKPCSQGTKMSKLLGEETLANHGPDLKEHKTPLQCLSAFVQDTFEDPKINHTGESTEFEASNNPSEDKFVKTENPPRNVKNEGKEKCKTVKPKQSASTALVSRDTKIKEVIANPEDGLGTSLKDDLQMRSGLNYNRKKKCKSVKEEQTVVRTMEEENSGSMLQSSSPAPQSVTTVTSLTVQGQVIESKPCSQGTKMSKVLGEETLANHVPDLKEHKTPLQYLSAFVQDTFEDPKINHTGESTFEASNNPSEDKFVKTENPPRNERNETEEKCKTVKPEQSASATLVSRDTKIKEVIATSLTDDLLNYNCKNKSVKDEQTVAQTMEEENSGVDKDKDLTASLTEISEGDMKVIEMRKYKTVKQKQLTSVKAADGIANSGDSLIAPLKNGSQMNQKGQLKGRRRYLAVKGKPREATSVEENKKVAGEVLVAENGVSTSLTENQRGDVKGKAVKERLALVGSIKRATRRVDEVPVKASQTTNTPGDVKAKAKNKPKSGKQKLSPAKSVENSIDIAAMLIKPENDRDILIESSPETEMKIKDKKKTKAVIKKQTGVGEGKRGKALADKVSTAKNSLKASLKGCSLGNLKGKSNSKKKPKLVKEENTATTLSNDASEMENNVFEMKNMILNSKDDPKGNLNKRSQVPLKSKGKIKCKTVKEELTVATLVVKEEVVNNRTDAIKSKRNAGQSSKKKTLTRTRKWLSGAQQKSETDTDTLVDQNVDSISQMFCKRGKSIASCFPTTTQRPSRASQVAKFEDAVASCDPDLATSSLTQFQPTPSMDLNIVKQKQDSSEMSKEYLKASETSPEEIVPLVSIDTNKEVKQDESTSSVAPIRKPQTKTSKRKRRRNKTGWDTKRKYKRPCREVNCSTTAEVVDHPPVDNSGLSFNSSLCNSILDEEIISLELKNGKDNLNESRSSEVSSADGKTNVNIKQTHTAVNRNDIEDMTVNTEPQRSAKLKHSATRQLKLKKKPIECSFCGQSFRHFSAFAVHKRIHTGEKPYRCLSCGKSFGQLSKLYSHSNIHKEPGAVQCPLCVSKFTNKDELIAHLKIHIKGAKKVNLMNNSREGKDTLSQQKADCMDSPIALKERMALRCSSCFKEFLNKATFKMHQQRHHEAKPYTCCVCGERFRKSSSLNIHEKTHWPVKPYACSVCGKGFVKLKELKSHSRTHSGEMPFSCANCGQAFSTLASLRSHQVSKVCFEKSDEGDGNTVDIDSFLATQGVEGRINTPVYYKCPICKQLHRHWCHYVLHLQTHTKSQTYLCETCGQQYDRVTRTYIHCKVCCNLSGEERDCSASLFETETETTTDQTLEPPLDSLSNGDDNHEISPVGDHDLQNQDRQSVSSPLETIEPETTMCQIIEPQLDSLSNDDDDQDLQNQDQLFFEKEMTDMLPTSPQPPRSPSPDSQSVSKYLDICQHSPSSSDCGSAGSTSPSVISCGSEQIDPQPPRFHSRSLIHRHYGRYSCGQCGKSFSQWNKLWLHQGLHRQRSSSFSCVQCGLQFRFFSSYMDHLLKHAAQRPYACPLCPKTFATEEDLNTHHCECHKPRHCIKCSTCGKDFTSVRKLKRHCLLHKGVSSHFCLPCDLSFPSIGALRDHLKTHRVHPSVPLPERPIEPFLFPYHCRKCTAKFTSSDLLQAHQVCHFIAGREPARPQADILSRLVSVLSVTREPGADAQAVISESPQQIRSLPVSNKKHLFRYPHPDRLYVVPIMASEPPVVISDTEEETAVVSPSAPNAPVNEIQPSANNDSSGQNVSNIQQSSAPYTPVVINGPESFQCRCMTQTDRDPLLPCALDLVPVHNESHHERSTDCDDASDSDDDDSSEASAALMTREGKECPIDLHNCAICEENFRNISKLHEHYLDHARGMM